MPHAIGIANGSRSAWVNGTISNWQPLDWAICGGGSICIYVWAGLSAGTSSGCAGCPVCFWSVQRPEGEFGLDGQDSDEMREKFLIFPTRTERTGDFQKGSAYLMQNATRGKPCTMNAHVR